MTPCSILARITSLSSATLRAQRTKYSGRATTEFTTIGMIHRLVASPTNLDNIIRHLNHIAAQQPEFEIQVSGPFITWNRSNFFVRLALSSNEFTKLKHRLNDKLGDILSYQRCLRGEVHLRKPSQKAKPVPWRENIVVTSNAIDPRPRTTVCTTWAREQAEHISENLQLLCPDKLGHW